MQRRSMLSQRLRNAIRIAGKPQYQIARAVGLHPVMLSNLMVGSRDATRDDRRVLAIGTLLGVPADECFEAPPGDSPIGGPR